MTFGLQCDEAHVARDPRRAPPTAGITFLDTADVYPLGGGARRRSAAPRRSSGAGCGARRDQFIVATKCVGAMGPSRGTRARRASTSSTRSTRRCGGCAPTTSTCTSCTSTTPTRRSTRRSRRSTTVVRSGKARYVGCSNFLAYQLARAIGRSEARGLARFDSVQPRYNLLFREIERELLPLCARGGDRRDPLQPARGRPAHRQARPRGAASGGHAVHARHRRRRCTRTATGTSASSTPSTRSRPLAADAGMSLTTLAVAWVLAQPGDHLADHRREPARAARRQRGRPRTSPLDAGERSGSTSSPPSTAAATPCADPPSRSSSP